MRRKSQADGPEVTSGTEGIKTPEKPGKDAEQSPAVAAAIARVKHLEPRERNYSYAAAAAAVAIFGVALIPNLHVPVRQGQLAPADFLAIGLAMAAMLAISTFIGRRALVAFSALFLAFMSTSLGSFVLGLPFLALGGWLLVRSWRFNKEAADAARAAARASNGSARSSGSGGSRTANASRGTAPGRSGARGGALARGSSASSPASTNGSTKHPASLGGFFRRILGREPEQPELIMRPPPPPPPSKRYTPPKVAAKAPKNVSKRRGEQ